MTQASFTTQTSNAPVAVAIKSVNLEGQTAVGFAPSVGDVNISFKLMPGGIYSVPAIGEQWIVQRTGRSSWQLVTMMPYQDERLNMEPSEGMTAIGRSGPTVIQGSSLRVPGELYVGGIKFVPGSGGGGSGDTPPPVLWDSEMVLNAGALASGYNDMAGGILVNSPPSGVMLDAVVFRLGGDPAANIGGTGGVTVQYFRGTTTSAEVTLLGSVTGITAHSAVLTLPAPILCAHNSVLRAKVTLGSSVISVACHVQWRGRRV